MADAVSGASKAVAMSLFGPQPSITIVTFWQGIVEIVLRGVSVVSSVSTASWADTYVYVFGHALRCMAARGGLSNGRRMVCCLFVLVVDSTVFCLHVWRERTVSTLVLKPARPYRAS